MLIPDSQSLSAIPLEARPENLRTSYQHFLSPSIEAVDSSRILLTGHSHQAWPDVAKEGILEAFVDAAHHVDDKWNAVFERAESVREEIARLCCPVPVMGARRARDAGGKGGHGRTVCRVARRVNRPKGRSGAANVKTFHIPS